MNRFLFNILHGQPLNQEYAYCKPENYRRFLDEKSATDWAVKFYSQWTDRYNEKYQFIDLSSCIQDEYSLDPVRYCCGYGARWVNNYLREIEVPTIEHNSFSDVLATVLIWAPKVPENVVAYRFVPHVVIQALLEANQSRKPYVDQGFMSCTLLFDPPNNAAFDYPDVLEIYVSSQSIGVYTNLLDGCRRAEFELLLQKNSKLVLIDYPYRKGHRTVYPVHLMNNMDSLQFLNDHFGVIQ